MCHKGGNLCKLYFIISGVVFSRKLEASEYCNQGTQIYAVKNVLTVNHLLNHLTVNHLIDGILKDGFVKNRPIKYQHKGHFMFQSLCPFNSRDEKIFKKTAEFIPLCFLELLLCVTSCLDTSVFD